MRWTASDFERLEPRLFRSFLAVVRSGSFSAAAQEASLTQGAISQQIAKLEERLNAQLFVRAGSRIVTTTAGRLLYEHAQAYMDHTTRFLEQLNEEFESMRGQVVYAMPESCIHAPHFGWLLQQRQAYPDLALSIELKPSERVLDDLLAGSIDFGFINRSVDLSAVYAYPFCREEYVLVSTGDQPLPPFPNSLDELLGLPMVLYPGMADCLNRWAAQHYADADPVAAVSLRMTGQFNDIRGALAMVAGGVGYSVLPRHVVQPAVDAGSLALLCAPDARQALQQIWIVRLKDKRMPARVKRVIGWFLQMHTELQPVPEEFLK